MQVFKFSDEDDGFGNCPHELHLHHYEGDWYASMDSHLWLRPICIWVHDPSHDILECHPFYVCGKASSDKEDLQFYSKERYDALMETL